MSVPISVKYLGDLRSEATHGPSHAKFFTDAPTDNQGKAASFSPTDLLATGLASCIATTMAIAARRHGLELDGAEVKTVKVMTNEGGRRIGSLATEVWLPIPSSHPERVTLERAAHTCPVKKSLHPDVNAPILFHYRET